MTGPAFVCTVGCCPGCQDCYGYSIGCHQDPCRCDRPCACRWPDEDTDPRWRDGCERHDSTNDRRWERDEPQVPDEVDLAEMSRQWEPCPECGQTGPCDYDAEGRPLAHVPEVEW